MTLHQPKRHHVLLFLLLTVAVIGTHGNPFKRRRDRARTAHQKELEAFHEIRKQFGEVGHSKEAESVREFKLRKKKRKGLLRKREASLAEVLFPGVAPEHYKDGENVFIIADNVQSKKTNVPFEFYDIMPGCQRPKMANFKRLRKRHQRKNLGNRLQGLELKPAPYELKFGEDIPCTLLCETVLEGFQVRWLRRLVEREYRVHSSFDQLPVLMRSQELNYAVKGFPVGFKAGIEYTGDGKRHLYLYNHLKFTITYFVDKESGDFLVTGFDVYPVSIRHADDGSTCVSTFPDDDNEEYEGPNNDPNTYLRLQGTNLPVKFSYEVTWQESNLTWENRWDVYFLNVADDDIHFFAIVNSLMIVLFLTGAIATIMIRTLRRDIAAYNEISLIEDGSEETGWKLVHGDVFRPTQSNPAILAVCVGTGAQIGTAFFITMLSALVGLVNPIRKGQTLTAILVLYVLSGSVNGYVSARISKFSGCKAWKRNTFIAATALPGLLVSMFTVLNVFLGIAGAATAVPFWLLLSIFALWVGVSSPLVFVGAFFGYSRDNISIPVKTNQIARIVPEQPFYTQPPASFALGGILPFGSVCIELFFIMSALWLHQIYYVMGFLLAVLLILAATCAQVGIVMSYLQLCAEDHRWWWKSFGNCASAGGYLFLYALWFLFSRLDLVGVLPVVIYLTYMGMISLCFGLFCGSVGFLCSFWFNMTIYGALKVD